MTQTMFSLYNVPMYTTQVDDQEEINKELSVAMDNSEFTMRADWGHTHFQTNPQFNEDFFKIHKVETFRKEILKHVGRFLAEVDYNEIIGLTVKCNIFSAWFAKYEIGSYATVHSHGHADISGIYYYQVPDDFGAELFFVSPIKVAETTPCFQFLSDKLNVQPKEGQIILFPGWLEHGVKTNLSHKPRIAVSFNVFLEKEEYKRMYE